jgi:hypothetical protein
MEISLNSELPAVGRSTGAASTGKRNSVQNPDTVSSFEQTHALNRSLDDLPMVRAEAVERGKSLVASEHYPPQEIQQRIARLLAVNLENQP